MPVDDKQALPILVHYLIERIHLLQTKRKKSWLSMKH